MKVRIVSLTRGKGVAVGMGADLVAMLVVVVVGTVEVGRHKLWMWSLLE